MPKEDWVHPPTRGGGGVHTEGEGEGGGAGDKDRSRAHAKWNGEMQGEVCMRPCMGVGVCMLVVATTYVLPTIQTCLE